jgi:hypothetical protein
VIFEKNLPTIFHTEFNGTKNRLKFKFAAFVADRFSFYDLFNKVWPFKFVITSWLQIKWFYFSSNNGDCYHEAWTIKPNCLNIENNKNFSFIILKNLSCLNLRVCNFIQFSKKASTDWPQKKFTMGCLPFRRHRWPGPRHPRCHYYF